MAKTINCNVSGVPIDAPYIRCDNGHTYVGVMNADLTRVSFTLLDTDTGGAHLNWDIHEANFPIPANPGAYEGGSLGLPNITYAPPPPLVSPIHVSGTGMFDAAGRPWQWRGATDFLLYKRYLDGEDVGPLVRERILVGANLVRVLGMAHYITRFYPQDYPEYYNSLRAFVDALATVGMYIEFVTFADQQEVKVSEQAHFVDCCTQLRGASNVFVELCNEYPKNGINPRQFTKPAGIVASAGSSTGDSAPDVFWDFFGWHGRRDWPKLANVDDMYLVANRENCAAVHDEPIGASEVDVPGRRTTSTLAMQSVASEAARLGNGGTFHSEAGLISMPWGPVQMQCAKVFFGALRG